MHNVIGKIFLILGSLLIASIMYSIIFTAEGQTFMWSRIAPAMEAHWQECTMNNGAKRDEIVTDLFDDIESIR